MLRPNALLRRAARTACAAPATRPTKVQLRPLSVAAARVSTPNPAPRTAQRSSPSVPSSVPLAHRRALSSTPHGDPGVDPSIAVRDMTDDEYHDVADEAMDTLHENLEALCEEHGPPEWEVEYSSGVMTLTLPPHGTYVINKQPPNHQIWLSSPFSGPSRFSLSPDDVWVHHRRKGVKLGELLDAELKKVADQDGEPGWQGTGLK